MRTVLHQVVLGQALQARSVGQALRHEQADREAQLVLLSGGPAVDVLEERWERCLLEGFLKIFIPSNEFVKNLDIRFYVLDLCRFLDIEDGERRKRSTVLDVTASWLEETADKDDLEKVCCIFEKLERAACLDELCGIGVEIGVWDSFKVLVKLISEYFRIYEKRWKLLWVRAPTNLQVRALPGPLRRPFVL